MWWSLKLEILSIFFRLLCTWKSIIPKLIKTPKKIFSYGVSYRDKNSDYAIQSFHEYIIENKSNNWEISTALSVSQQGWGFY